MSDEKKQLDESVSYFDEFVNQVLVQNIEGVAPLELMKHYNLIRNELSKLYVDVG